MSAFQVFAAIFNQGITKGRSDLMKYMANAAEELSTVSNVNVHL